MEAGLKDKISLVTGGGSGIGEACVRLLHASGAKIVIADVNENAAIRLADELGENAAAVQVDIASGESCQAMVDTTLKTFGRLDIAINNAGVTSIHSPITQLPLEEWRRVMAVNLDGQFLCLKAEMPAMAASGGGAIVNMASVMASVAVAGASAYVASKHAVVGLTKAAALEGAPQGIRVNALGPGYVETPLLQKASRDRLDEIASMHALGRIAHPSEIAAAAAFLISPAASFITGTYYPVDGGYLAR